MKTKVGLSRLVEAADGFFYTADIWTNQENNGRGCGKN